MFVDVGIIGVPRGFCAVTESAKDGYEKDLGMYYTDAVRDAGKQMRISRRKDGWVLYTYTVGAKGGNFSDVAGRTGSFFGIVLGMKDGEVIQPISIYNLLNHVYETSVRGKMIYDDGKNKKWLIGVGDLVAARQNIEDAVLGRLPDFVDFKSGFQKFKFNPSAQNNLLYNPPHQGDTPSVAEQAAMAQAVANKKQKD